MLREDLGPIVEADSRRWELVVNAYRGSIIGVGPFLFGVIGPFTSDRFDGLQSVGVWLSLR